MSENTEAALTFAICILILVIIYFILKKTARYRFLRRTYKDIKYYGQLSFKYGVSIWIFSDDINDELRECPLKNGKIGLIKILSCRDDPEGWGSYDIVAGLVSYKDEKPFAEMSYEEFLQSDLISEEMIARYLKDNLL